MIHSDQSVAIFHDLPADILYSIIPYLSKSDTLNLRVVDKTLREKIDRLFRLILELSTFNDYYGAIASCENVGMMEGQVLPYQLARRIDRAFVFKERIEQNHLPTSWHTATTHPIPQKWRRDAVYSTPFQDSRIPPNLDEVIEITPPLTIWQRIWQKIQLLTGYYHLKIYAEAKKVHLQHVKIIQEFLNSPLDQENPLQDLRNRCHRVLRIEKERDAVVSGLQQIYDKFKILEKIIFIFTTSLWSLLFKLKGDSAYQLPALPISGKSFLGRKELHLKDVVFKHNEQMVSTEIVANFWIDFRDMLSKDIYFEIRDKQTHQLKGTLILYRSWKENYLDADENHILTHASKPLGDRYLRFKMRDDLSQDILTGDAPVSRILTQLAIEVFQREVESKFEGEIQNNEPYVPIAGGFGLKNVGRWEDDVQKAQKSYVDEIQKAHRQGQVFPRLYNQAPTIYLQIYKTENAELHGTQFVRCLEEEQEPAHVGFTADGPAKMWEEVIANDPILPPSEGPFLPKFNSRNLYLLEE